MTKNVTEQDVCISGLAGVDAIRGAGEVRSEAYSEYGEQELGSRNKEVRRSS